MDETLDSLNPEESAWQAFVEQWKEKFREAPVTTADLLPLAYGEHTSNGSFEPGPLSDYIDAKDDTDRKKRLGKALAERRDRVYAAHRIKRLPATKTTQYRLDDLSRGGLGDLGGFCNSNANESQARETMGRCAETNPLDPPNPPGETSPVDDNDDPLLSDPFRDEEEGDPLAWTRS